MTAFVDGNGNVVVVCFVVFRRSCEEKLYLIVSRLEDVFNALWHSSVSHVWVVFEIPFGSRIDNECLCNFARQVHDLYQIGHFPGYPRSRERCARTPRLAGWSTDMHSFVGVTSNTTNVRLLEELEDWASARVACDGAVKASGVHHERIDRVGRCTNFLGAILVLFVGSCNHEDDVVELGLELVEHCSFWRHEVARSADRRAKGEVPHLDVPVVSDDAPNTTHDRERAETSRLRDAEMPYAEPPTVVIKLRVNVWTIDDERGYRRSVQPVLWFDFLFC